LTRRELAHAVYSVCPGLSRGQAKGFVDAVIEEIVSALAVGEDVSLRGVGSNRSHPLPLTLSVAAGSAFV
jgi:nucleoid DNA-binding protein